MASSLTALPPPARPSSNSRSPVAATQPPPHPTRAQAVASARRPGTFALVIDCATSTTTRRLTPPEGLQINGHGAFSADGTRLITSEVIAETSQGRIGLWNTRDYTRLTDWPSHGIGPHDIRLLPDGRLAVSNGCIQTDPVDRTKLNLRTMRPTLTLPTQDGALQDQIDLPDLPRNSIRHLAPMGDTIAFAMQREGDAAEPVPQLGLWRPGSAPALCEPTPAEAFTLQGYAGSVAATADRVLITSPKGGGAMIFVADGTPGRHPPPRRPPRRGNPHRWFPPDRRSPRTVGGG